MLSFPMVAILINIGLNGWRTVDVCGEVSRWKHERDESSGNREHGTVSLLSYPQLFKLNYFI
jgi:hypothetical protein